ncbi:methyl-accepting chemotaxis protein [Paraburkholderia sp. EG287A]|uniref:methyl-accepting chemotaxis protein n=1 Tax=Paraburkholderia sp. EG287A TaxID=3237012 RepID=UPI0034D2E592
MKLSFSKKLWIPSVVGAVCLVAVSGFDAWQLRATRISEREVQLAAATDIAVNTLRRYSGEVDAGKMDVAEARKRAVAAVRAMTYGKDGYFLILDDSYVIQLHTAKPEKEGKDVSNDHDQHGFNQYQAAVHLTSGQGSGYVQYEFPKPGSTTPEPKISYAAGFAPWHWTVMTGAYIDDINDAFLSSVYRSLGVLAGAFAMLALVSVFVNRGLRRTLGGEPEYAMEVANRIANSDLTHPVAVSAGDDSSLLRAMARMQVELSRTLGGIKSSAESIASASSQIAAGNQDLAQRTEEQAASLEQTAASMDELNSTVEQNTENARLAAKVAEETNHVTQRGSGVVSHVVETMDGIKDSSARIADITGIIEGISFQTNILALNAAVEAARAGEQGRGFAVVASEVRSLAQRSAAASKEIKGLIDEALARVQTGVGFAHEAGEAMADVRTAAQRVANLMNEITAASEEQGRGVGMVHQAVGMMDSVTQQNAALVEEATAAAHSLDAQAAGLREAVSRFHLSDAASM